MRILSCLKFKFNSAYLLLFMLIFVTACSNTQSRSGNVVSEKVSEKAPNKHKKMTEEDLLFSLLRNEYLYWKGTPYRLGGNNKKGIDCSALVQAVYKNSFNIVISRTTNKQAKSGFFVYPNALKVGDLVFFKTSWKVQHVGVYIGDNQFLHASTSKGVMLSSLDNVYWRSKYWQSRRILH